MMLSVNRKSEIANGGWLPDMDLNHDKQIQSLLCYRYTIGQDGADKIDTLKEESRIVKMLNRYIVTSETPGAIFGAIQRFNSSTN